MTWRQRSYECTELVAVPLVLPPLLQRGARQEMCRAHVGTGKRGSVWPALRSSATLPSPVRWPALSGHKRWSSRVRTQWRCDWHHHACDAPEPSYLLLGRDLSSPRGPLTLAAGHSESVTQVASGTRSCRTVYLKGLQLSRDVCW